MFLFAAARKFSKYTFRTASERRFIVHALVTSFAFDSVLSFVVFFRSDFRYFSVPDCARPLFMLTLTRRTLRLHAFTTALLFTPIRLTCTVSTRLA